MDRADVIILGGGLVGLALAAALDSSGLSAIVVDPADPEQRKDAAFDGRTSAVSSSSMRMLETIGVADHFPEPGCPIRRIAGRRRPRARRPALRCRTTMTSRSAGCTRTATCAPPCAPAPRPGTICGCCGSRAVTSVERGDHGVTVALADGRKLSRAAAGRRRRAQLADARGGRDPRRALEIRPSGDRLDASPRTPARPCRLRDLLSDAARSRCCR